MNSPHARNLAMLVKKLEKLEAHNFDRLLVKSLIAQMSQLADIVLKQPGAAHGKETKKVVVDEHSGVEVVHWGENDKTKKP